MPSIVPGVPADGEESVEQYVRRNLGKEVFERLVEPFCSGVYAGDPSKLSMTAAFGKVPPLHPVLFCCCIAAAAGLLLLLLLQISTAPAQLPYLLVLRLFVAGAVELVYPGGLECPAVEVVALTH